MRPLRSELEKLYGVITNSFWADQATWMLATTVPGFLEPYWRYHGLKVSTIYCHKHMKEPLFKAFDLIKSSGLESCITSYDGCLAIRPSRRNQKQSVHSWGLAIDLNADKNKLGMKPTMPAALVACFESAGFVWGGSWHVPDGMHFQYVTED